MFPPEEALDLGIKASELGLEHGIPEDQSYAAIIVRQYPHLIEENPLALLHVIQALVYGWTDFDEIPMPDATTLARGFQLLPKGLNFSEAVQGAVLHLLHEDGVVYPFPPFDFLPVAAFEEPDPEVYNNQKRYFSILTEKGPELWKP